MSFWDFLKKKKKIKKNRTKRKKKTSVVSPTMPGEPLTKIRSFPYYYTWHKSKTVIFTPHFYSYEFECPCDSRSCRVQKISIELLKRLQHLRDTLGLPLRINSGYRCKTYQEKLRKRGYKTAKKTSQHSLGKAADVGILGGHSVTKRMKKFLVEAEVLFEAIGIGSKFLHLDLRTGKKRRWYY